jgi:hypothetical protein
MPLTHDEYWTERRYWWNRPAFYVPSVVLLLLAVPMALWIASYGDPIAVVAFLVTYCSLLVFVLLAIRRGLLDVHEKVNTQTIDRVKSDIREQREQLRSGLADADLSAARHGAPAHLLDVWLLDENLRDRHRFFDRLRASSILPGTRDLGIRIHVEENAALLSHPRSASLFLMDVRDFLFILIADPHFRRLKSHLDAVLLVICTAEDDRSFEGTPVPILSLHARIPELERYVARESPSGSFPGSLRFERGRPIIPHREIPIDASRGKG